MRKNYDESLKSNGNAKNRPDRVCLSGRFFEDKISIAAQAVLCG